LIRAKCSAAEARLQSGANRPAERRNAADLAGCGTSALEFCNVTASRVFAVEADPFTAIAGGGGVTAETHGEKEVANAPAAQRGRRLPGFLSAPAFRAGHSPPVRLSHPALRQLTFVVGNRPFVPARVAAPHHRHRRAADRVLGAYAAYDAAVETLFGQSQA
jgi:hypothetical protein